MAVKKTKKLGTVTEVTTIADSQKIVMVDANSKTARISLANLKAAILAGINLNGLYDGVIFNVSVSQAMVTR